MPRKKQTQRKDGMFEYKTTVGRDIKGNAIRKSFYSSKSKADAKRKAEQYKLEKEVAARTGTAFVSSADTFAAWARKWLETYKRPFVDENTYKLTYKSIIEGHLIPYFGDMPLAVIHPIDVVSYFGTKTKCSESRLKKMKSILTAIFDAAIDNDLCYKNPAKNSEYNSEAVKKEKQVYTDEQIALVKQHARAAMPEVAFLLETGLRRGELLGLMWADFDEQGRTISVNRSMTVKGGAVTANPPKWDSYRTLPLSAEAYAILRAQPHTSLYIFPNAKSAPHAPSSWSQKLGRYMAQLHDEHPEVPCLTAHELRHTYGTALRRHGVDIYTIQKLLGHRDIKVTTEIYVHNEIEVLRAAIT